MVFLLIFAIDHVLHAGVRRLFPRVQQLHSGRPAEDAAAYRAGLVLHAVSTRSCARPRLDFMYVLAAAVVAYAILILAQRRKRQGEDA